MEFLGFCIFMSVFWACETWLYSKGHSTMIHKHKTVHEKAIQSQQSGVK